MSDDGAKAESELEALAQVFGVVGLPARGMVAVRDGWALIGAVISAPGGVRYVPRHGITAEQRLRLVAAATQVCLHGRIALPEWRFDPRRGWMGGVKARQPASGESSSAASSLISSSDSLYPVVSAGLREPSGI